MNVNLPHVSMTSLPINSARVAIAVKASLFAKGCGCFASAHKNGACFAIASLPISDLADEKSVTLLSSKFALGLSDPAEVTLVTIASWYEGKHAAGRARGLRDFQTAPEMLKTVPHARRQPSRSSTSRQYTVHPYTMHDERDEVADVISIRAVVHGSMDIDSNDD